MAMAEVERLTLRVSEAAAALGVSRSKMYELVSSGSVPSVRVGATVLVPADALRAWLKKQTSGK